MNPRRSPEDALQRQIIQWARVAAPQTLVAHIPNGGKRGLIEAAKFKALGVLAGMPDLVVCAPNAFVGFIEVKGPQGALSQSQKAIRDELQKCRIPWAVARSVEDMRTIFAAWNIETREAAA